MTNNNEREGGMFIGEFGGNVCCDANNHRREEYYPLGDPDDYSGPEWEEWVDSFWYEECLRMNKEEEEDMTQDLSVLPSGRFKPFRRRCKRR